MGIGICVGNNSTLSDFSYDVYCQDTSEFIDYLNYHKGDLGIGHMCIPSKVSDNVLGGIYVEMLLMYDEEYDIINQSFQLEFCEDSEEDVVLYLQSKIKFYLKKKFNAGEIT